MSVKQWVNQLMRWLPLPTSAKIRILHSLNSLRITLMRRQLDRAVFLPEPKNFTQQDPFATCLAPFAQLAPEHSVAVVVYEKHSDNARGSEQAKFEVACAHLNRLDQINQLTQSGCSIRELTDRIPSAVLLSCDNLAGLLRSMARRFEYLYLIAAGTEIVMGHVSDLYDVLISQAMFGCSIPGNQTKMLSCMKTDEQFEHYKRHIPPYFVRSYSQHLGCMLVRSDLLLDYFPGEKDFTQALHTFVAHINCKGYSVALCNYVWSSERDEDRAVDAALKLLGEQSFPTYIESSRIKSEENRLSLLCAALQDNPGFLFDLSGLSGLKAGSTKFYLKFLAALSSSPLGKYHCDILVTEMAESCCKLSQQFPQLSFIHTVEGRYYKAALRIGQPTDMAQCSMLAEHAYFNFYFFMDMIAYDCHYMKKSVTLEKVYQFVANYSDGILSISQFTQDQLRRSFPAYVAQPPKHCAARLSLEASDHRLSDMRDKQSGAKISRILVVGSRLEHKNTAEVMTFLPVLFPQCDFKVLGAAIKVAAKNVQGYQSGCLDDGVVNDLYQWADVVIFPSSYEGFGLPLFEGLAYGKCVFVRQSLLNEELLSRYHGPGSAVSYANFEQLHADLLSYIEDKHSMVEKTFLTDQPAHTYETMLKAVSDFVLEQTSLERESVFRQRQAVLDLMA